MQERGSAQAIGTLELGDGDPIGQAQMVKRVTGLNAVKNPGVWMAARHRGLGRRSRQIDYYTGNQLRRCQAVGLLEFGTADMIACCNLVECIAILDDIG